MPDVSSLEITISSFRWYSSSAAKEQNKSWTSESRITFPLRSFLPTVLSTNCDYHSVCRSFNQLIHFCIPAHLIFFLQACNFNHLGIKALSEKTLVISFLRVGRLIHLWAHPVLRCTFEHHQISATFQF